MQGWGFVNLPSLLYLPCLHTFWHAIPTYFYFFNVFKSCYFHTCVLYCRWLCSPPPLDSRILYTVIHLTGSLIMNTGYREVSSMAGKWSDLGWAWDSPTLVCGLLTVALFPVLPTVQYAKMEGEDLTHSVFVVSVQVLGFWTYTKWKTCYCLKQRMCTKCVLLIGDPSPPLST